MYSVDDLESIDLEEVDKLEYPCMLLKKIVAKNQFNQFLIPDGSLTEVMKVRAYGEKNNRPKFLGYIPLTSKVILKLNYMNIDVVYYESENKFTTFNDDNDLVKICTFKELINRAYSLNCTNNDNRVSDS